MTTAADVLAANLVWDNHVCMPLRPHDQTFLPQLDRWKRIGADVVFLNVGFGDASIEEHIRVIANFRHWLQLHSAEYVIIDTVDDIQRARDSGRLAVGFNIEGANAIADQTSLIQLYYELGVRWMLIAYNRNNRVGGGCQDDDTGLTAFGRDVIDEMARVGMMVCCSHTGAKTTMDVMEYSSKPVILSHSTPRALHDHPRNVTDEAMRACARTGGVVGLNGIQESSSATTTTRPKRSSATSTTSFSCSAPTTWRWASTTRSIRRRSRSTSPRCGRRFRPDWAMKRESD